jgi:hypothetical protein
VKGWRTTVRHPHQLHFLDAKAQSQGGTDERAHAAARRHPHRHAARQGLSPRLLIAFTLPRVNRLRGRNWTKRRSAWGGRIPCAPVRSAHGTQLTDSSARVDRSSGGRAFDDPKPTLLHHSKLLIFDHLVDAYEQRGRHGEAKTLGSSEVDRQLVFGVLFNGEVNRLNAVENSRGVGR